MNFEKGKLYSFKIKDRKKEEKGIVIANGEDWILLKHLFTDYIIDGYILLNKSYIKAINRDEDIIFIESVLKANNKINISKNLTLPLSIKLLFEWLSDNQIVFQIDNKDESMCWIGKIEDSTDKSIFLTNFTPKGTWKTSYYTFRKNNIRIISFDTDYINSLLNYNKTL